MTGKTMAEIAKSAKKSENTVKKYMGKAAAAMVETAQQEVMNEVFPLAKQVFIAALKREIAVAKEGKEPNLALADRIMKGMQILDTEIPPVPTDDDSHNFGEVQTMAAFIATRQPVKRIGDKVDMTIDVEPVEVKDGKQDNPVNQSENE